jgi:hypothetical protein
MEKIPEVEIEKVETEMSTEDKLAQLKKLGAEFSEQEIKDAFEIKSDAVVVPAVVPEATSFAKQLSPETTMIAKTLMSTAEQKVKGIYADADYSGIMNADLDLLTKVTLMESVIVPNAIKMANIEKNLKSNDANDTRIETKSGEFSAPAKTGKVDEEAGMKLLTEMSEKLGFDIDEKENSV